MMSRTAVSVFVVLSLAAAAAAQTPETIPTEPTPLAGPAETTAVGKVMALFDGLAGAPDGTPKQWGVSADYLFASMRGTGLPPLVTTSPAGTAMASAGVLGMPGTRVLFGNQDVNDDLRAGFRLGVDGWFDHDRTLGVEAAFFMLESQNTPFAASSTGTPILARPFEDATTGAQTSQLIAFPGAFSGSVAVSDRSGNLYGANIDFKEVISSCHGCRIEALVGYRFLRYDDGLSVQQNVLATGGTTVVAAGTRIETLDRFTAENAFHGLDVGLRAEMGFERLSVGLLAKLAVGDLTREVTIAGATRTTVPGAAAPAVSTGGMLALASNSGAHYPDDWVVVPELGVTLGYDITTNVRLRLGYSMLYWTNVARSADQVDLTINPALFPPATTTPTTGSRPAFSLTKADVWVQSFNVGFEFRF
jgi:hypothetical protein